MIGVGCHGVFMKVVYWVLILLMRVWCWFRVRIVPTNEETIFVPLVCGVEIFCRVHVLSGKKLL